MTIKSKVLKEIDNQNMYTDEWVIDLTLAKVRQTIEGEIGEYENDMCDWFVQKSDALKDILKEL